MRVNPVFIKISQLILMSVVNGNFFKSTESSIENFLGLHLKNYLADIGKKLFINKDSNEDTDLSIKELIVKYGYHVETYEVITEDGYILTIYRIPSFGRPVLLVHGLLASADDWVIPGPQSGIAYLLAAEGYDVWLANVRGNKYSRRHERLSPDSAEFWDFSWDEMGRYDLPVTIDLVLNITQYTQLIYVGHSQGTTCFFVMGSERPEYNEKISLMIALAPVTAIPNQKSPIVTFLKYAFLWQPDLLFNPIRRLGYNEFLPDGESKELFQKVICRNDVLAEYICANIYFLFCGFSYSQLNVTHLPVIFAHIPSEAAMKQLQHYAQVMVTGVFRRFNYGRKKNKIVYGSKIPQDYNLGLITTPVALFYAENDFLATEPDVLNLKVKLKNLIDLYKVPDKTFNHYDFLFGLDVNRLIFPRLLKLIKKSQ